MGKDPHRSLEWEKTISQSSKSLWLCVLCSHSKEKRHKLYETSEKCIFIGYGSHSKCYKLYSLKTKQVIIKHDVIFDENAKWNLEK